MPYTQPKIVAPYAAAVIKSVNLASCAPQAKIETSVAWPGVDVNSLVFARADSLHSGLVLENPCVTVSGGVVLRVSNITAAGIDQAAQDFYLIRL